MMHTALLTAPALLAQARGDHMRGWDGGWMWLWGTLMMLTWAAVIGVAVWLILRSTRRGDSSSARAKEILDERFARGELTIEEYRERREALR
jgi:putative membrane protein